MKKISKIVAFVVLIMLLIGIRIVIAPMLYDPFANYFKVDYLYNSVPNVDLVKLIFSIFIRYSLNGIVSIVMIWILFNDKKTGWFATKIYLFVFVILSLFLIVILESNYFDGYLLLFYVRRLLIHPILVLLLIPAFYFQKVHNSKNLKS